MQTIGCLFVRGGAHASLDRLSNDRIKITKQQNARWYYGKSFVRLHTIEWKSACKWVHFYVHTHGITSFFRAVFFLSWPARYLEVYFIVYFLLPPLLFSSNFTMQFFFVDLSHSLSAIVSWIWLLLVVAKLHRIANLCNGIAPWVMW